MAIVGSTRFVELLPVTATFVRRALLDTLPAVRRGADAGTSLNEAIAWLKRAQDATPDDGVAQGYYWLRGMRWGWLASYRETSGYIAETLLDVAEALKDNDARERAIRIGKWLVQVQNKDGSFSNPNYGERGIVFDTGQVLIGLVRVYQASQDPEILKAAQRAGQWLVDRVDDDGAFRRNTHNDCVHTYNSRVAWSMLMLHGIDPNDKLAAAAQRNLDWCLAQEQNGWFQNNAFTDPGIPFTHNIAYAIRGVLEGGLCLNDTKYQDTAIRAARAMLPHVREDGYVSSRIDHSGIEHGNSCCLTGNCQLAIIWFKLFKITKDAEFRDAAQRSLNYVVARQDVRTDNQNIRGAVPGSFPIYGRYSSLAYPNWATKFFIDAMLLAKEVDECVSKS